MLSGWQEILVEMTAAAVAIHRLIQSLFQYRRHKTNAKIKIKRGGTSVEVPSERVSDEQMRKIVDFMTDPESRDRKNAGEIPLARGSKQSQKGHVD
jgi:hypothetical protein